ncbi:TMV resistance protein N-like [Eucalyptus grandis]|uniref:TMV resistance protein N-like n=1 Tax=Eucalyptus grandis TaxID=71139 RepID=UPI00192E87EB|nr:TMV resistance protein N-like [Eucalyptus grandis]
MVGQHAIKRICCLFTIETVQLCCSDGDLIEAVVVEVVVRLKTRQRKVTRDLVGMEDRIAAINGLLDIQSGGVRVIGIYGMSGIGKSTLTKIIYNQLCPRFGKNCSFLDGVRETTKTKGLVKLQEQLLYDISNSRVARNIDNIDYGINTIRETICNKKVLVVLDDVDEGNQIEYLIGIDSLYNGTRILVTTRDKSVIKIRGLKYEIVPYEMEVLSDKDALQLFSRHAFDADFPPDKLYDTSKDIVSTTDGLPSALRAIGSLLFLQKEEKIWQEMLEKLRKTPTSDVLGKLRITYDALEMDQQQIFLDIACFFIDKDKTNPFFVWKDCGFSPEYAIDVLINKCTIKVLDENKFWMHDQFRDLGRTIANQERSRLWAPDDIIHELRSIETVPNLSNLTNLVELLLSDGSESKATSNIIKACDLQWIGRLSKLRKQHLCLLNVRAQPTELGSLSLLKKLTMYGLDFESLEQLPSSLIVLELDRIQVKQVQLDGLPQLEKLTIRMCELVKRLSFPSGLRKLREAEVSSCTELVEVQFLGALISLEELCIEDCRSLERFVNPSEELGCNELQATKLTNGGRKVSIVSSLLKMLQVFQLLRCPKLEEIQFACMFKSLGVFSVEGCTSLKRIGGLSNLKNLTRLGIVECESLQVVEGVDELEHLEQLKVYRCRSMERMIDVSSSKKPKECQIQMRDCGELLDIGPDDSSITWESYREKILNAPARALGLKLETTLYDYETKIETRDLLLEQQDDSDKHEDGDKVDGREDDNSEDSGKEDDDDDNHVNIDDDDDGKEEDDDDNHVHVDNEDDDSEDDENVHSSGRPSPVCSMGNNDKNEGVDKEGQCEGDGNSDSKDNEDENDNGEDDEDNNVHELLHSSDGPSLVGSVDGNDENDNVVEEGQWEGNISSHSKDDEDEDDDGEDDEDNNVHRLSHLSSGPSLVGSVDGNDENDDVDEEGQYESDGNSHSKDDEDEDNDGEDDEDNIMRELSQSSRGPSPVGSVDDNVENDDFNEEGEGDGYSYSYGDGNDDEGKDEDEERDDEEGEQEQDDGDDYNNNEYDEDTKDNSDKAGDEGDYNSEVDDGY